MGILELAKICRPSDYLPLVVMVAGEAGDIPGSRLSGKTAASYDGEAAEGAGMRMGFLTEEGLRDWSGTLTPVKRDDKILIAHPSDLYKEGHWHEYQKFLFDNQLRQPFKQVFRELYVKLQEEA
ncbi:MAG: DUF4132 domain-containing protein [Eisenbergiella sp.]